MSEPFMLADDPFGPSDALPKPTTERGFVSRAKPRAARDFGGDPETNREASERAKAAKEKTKVNRAYMVRRACEILHRDGADRVLPGGFYAPCESQITTYSGMVIKRDLFGFADACGVSDGQFIAVQVTTPEKVNAHLRSYIDPTNRVAGRSVKENLLAFTGNGGVFLFATYEKENGRWVFKFRRIDSTDLEAAEGRRRKKT